MSSPPTTAKTQLPLPPELRTTAELLERAFPEGLDAARSLRVAKVLYPHMSHRSLATALAWAVDGDPTNYPSFLNTVYAAFHLPADDPDLPNIFTRLADAGLQAWIDEED